MKTAKWTIQWPIECAKKSKTLKQYLEERGVKQNFFAKEIKATPETITRIIQLGYAPSLKLAIEIEKYTKGEVSVYGWDLKRSAHCVNPEDKDNQKNKQDDD